ncbi:MAG: sigma-70 family RNA polymerase sigma factor [Bacteroidales bacterium]|nr:sigma-70 family RNA polymerase sigma factor [Bacteroidales bacterium]
MALKVSWKKYQDASDEVLMRRFRASGDLEQLGALYERYMHLVYGVCLKYFADREAAKDGITTIFEKLIVELPKHEVEDFKSWLYVLTKNFCLMKIRAGKSAQRKQEAWQIDQETFMEPVEEMHPIDEEDNNLNKTLMECIERLKGEQQQCIRLFYFEERSYKEIAAALALEEKKIKSFIQNGKRNLKICIENKNNVKGRSLQ